MGFSGFYHPSIAWLQYSIILFIFFHANPISAGVEFELDSLSELDVTFLGDARMMGRAIALTQEDVSRAHPSWGSVYYNKRIELQRFSTNFVFVMENFRTEDSDDEASGEGMCFVLAADKYVGNPEILGLPAKGRFIGIEFDIKLNNPSDPDDNHIGIDVGTVKSVKSATVYDVGIGLNSGEVINVWVEYQEEQLAVWVSYEEIKPNTPLLRLHIDILKHIGDQIYVGFTGSTMSTSTVLSTRIEYWSFTGLSSPPPPPPPRAYFEPGEIKIDRPPVALTLSIIVVGSCCIFFLLWLLVWFRMKKSMGIRTSNIEMVSQLGKCKHMIPLNWKSKKLRSRRKIKKVNISSEDLNLLIAMWDRMSINDYNNVVDEIQHSSPIIPVH